MKVAVYQGFPTIHYEMLGYIIDYFLTSNINIEIYAHLSEVGKDWHYFFEKVFNTKLIFLNPTSFNPKSYELIFLVTDDDFTFNQDWLNNYKDRIICIDHSAKIRRGPIDLTRVGTRFFYYRPRCLWALPICTYITKPEKEQHLKNVDKINVLCIGIQNRPVSGEFLASLFTNFNSIDFHVIARELDSRYDNYSNIKTYENCSTCFMMNLVKTSHYMLCFENPLNLEPVANSMSAAVPLSFSVGCQLIIPQTWEKYYKFTSVITYEDSLLQKYDKTSKLTLSKDINLSDIYEECYQYISHRNFTFDQILNKKIKNTVTTLSKNINSSFLDKITDILTYSKPKILVDTTSNLINLVDEFREVHITNNNIISNNRKIFYHTDLIDYINKNKLLPIVIYLKEIYSLGCYLTCLSNRIHSDVIVFEGISDNINEIIKHYYTRKYSIYYMENEFTIIFPQM